MLTGEGSRASPSSAAWSWWYPTAHGAREDALKKGTKEGKPLPAPIAIPKGQGASRDGKGTLHANEGGCQRGGNNCLWSPRLPVTGEKAGDYESMGLPIKNPLSK